MQNASLTIGFLTRNSSLGELCILHIWKRWEMLFRGIVKKCIADLILLTKFKKIIGMKEKFVKNMEVPVALMELLLQTQRSFGIFFLFDDLHFTMLFRGSVPRLTLWCCISISQYLCKPFASRFVFTSMSDKKMNLGSFRGVCMLGTRM